MNSHSRFRDVLAQTRVLRFPRHRLATFGLSEIRYHIVSPVPGEPARSTLRTGAITAERPRILTKDALVRQFEGFGEDAERFEGWLKDAFAEAFRGLEYTFRNRLDETAPHRLDARELAENIRRDLDGRDAGREALILAPEKGWSFSLMKFVLEETTQSFPSNVRELEERGLFDPARAALNRRAREIEGLFDEAAGGDSAALARLGRALKDSGLFDEYQDRFFALVRKNG